MELVISGGIFIVILLVFAGAFVLLRRRLDPESRVIRKKLVEISTGLEGEGYAGEIDIRKKRRLLSDIPLLNRLFLSIPLLRRIDRLLLHADIKQPLGVFILISCVLAVAGFFVTGFLMRGYLCSFLIAACLSTMPLFYVSLKKKRRMKKFERQLPEVLDLITRSLRAGHAFTTALQMVTEEFEDPISTEFGAVTDEISFGMEAKESLSALAERVDCEELKFFVVVLAVQRETGGNLCEILEKMSSLIRGRFKLDGIIHTLTAEGKLSAMILVALPFFVGIAMTILSPDYIKILVTDPLGKLFISTAFFLMVVGIVAMKKIISIKV